MLTLVKPNSLYKQSFLLGLHEFQAEGLAWHVALDADAINSDFEAFVQRLLAKTTLRTETLVPETELWAVVNHQYVGRISIRHELNDALRRVGGHIGYDVIPSARGKGYASQMLKLALVIAKKLGIKDLLLTCNDTNAHSIRVIEKCGGILLKTEQPDPALPIKRYYSIELT